MNHFFLPLCLLALFATKCKAQPNTMNQISKNGMTVTWHLEGERLHLTMKAPTQGWIAVGFNTVDELTGTNLIMGCVTNGEVTLSDRHILSPGHHQSIEKLGGTSAVQLISGQETDNETQIRFSLPLQVNDPWHLELKPGNQYHLLLAFSQEDDFLHHSMMRCAVKFSL